MDKKLLAKLKYIESNDSSYEIIDYLGKGSYAIVVRARNIKNDQIVAIKIGIIKDCDDDQNNRIELLAKKEAKILFQLRSHRNIVEIFDYFQSNDNHSYLILELCVNKVRLFEV